MYITSYHFITFDLSDKWLTFLSHLISHFGCLKLDSRVDRSETRFHLLFNDYDVPCRTHGHCHQSTLRMFLWRSFYRRSFPSAPEWRSGVTALTSHPCLKQDVGTRQVEISAHKDFFILPCTQETWNSRSLLVNRDSICKMTTWWHISTHHTDYTGIPLAARKS